MCHPKCLTSYFCYCWSLRAGTLISASFWIFLDVLCLLWNGWFFIGHFECQELKNATVDCSRYTRERELEKSGNEDDGNITIKLCDE